MTFVQRLPRTFAVVFLMFVAACESTSPDPVEESDGMLTVSGRVVEEDTIPAPALEIVISAWTAGEHQPAFEIRTLTNDQGRYSTEVGPFQAPLVDSVRVMIQQADCDRWLLTSVVRRSIELEQGSELDVADLHLSFRLEPGHGGQGSDVCAVILNWPFGSQSPPNFSRLAIWVDEESDSVRGRWRLNHSASFGDSYGYFSGTRDGLSYQLFLRDQPESPCTGIEVTMHWRSATGAIPPPSKVKSDGSCIIPDANVRFFEGAELPELLPPLPG